MDSKAMTCKTIYSAVLSISFSRVFILFIFPNYFIFMKMKDRRDNKTINQVRNCCYVVKYGFFYAKCRAGACRESMN